MNSSRRYIALAVAFAIIASIGGYLIWGGYTYPANSPIFNIDGKGYGFKTLEPNGNSDELFIIVTFSGGGTRAAALSYGVLEYLRETKIKVHGELRRLIDEIDVISSVSGGSFTAAYYGLFRENLFKKFPEVFLYRNIEKELKYRLLLPTNWLRLASSTYGRIDMASEFYDIEIFNNATFADLRERGRPLILINATDMSVGSQFTFTQEQFNYICSDLSKFPVARAVAASSNFPVAFTPLTLNNYSGDCGFQTPVWITLALDDAGINAARFHRARVMNSYLDSKIRKHIHLLDGGISDNIGLLAPLVALSSIDTEWSLLRDINTGRVKDIVVIIVDAKTNASIRFDDSPTPPNLIDIVETISTVPMQNYSAATVRDLFQLFEEHTGNQRIVDDCMRLLKQLCPSATAPLPPLRKIGMHAVYVGYDSIKDEKLRSYFNQIPTSFSLSEEEIHALRKIGGDLLNQSQEFQGFLRMYGGIR
jgi:NTE family protein